MAFRELLGCDTLIGKSGDVSTSSLEGKLTFLYFSAHWCPPCRGFTPKLAEFYKNLGGKAEIVFVSSDRSEAEFKSYYDESHPWLALPYAQRDIKEKLSKKFKVDGIPTLVLLNGNAEVVTRNGRGIVESDPTGADCPWSSVNANVLELLGTGPINTHDSKGLTTADLTQPGSYFAIYFSAHWCPPCVQFTPKFAETYKTLKAAGKPFNVIFASWDREEAQFAEYFKSMPWAALPFDDPRIQKISGRFEVEGIPTVLMFDSQGNVVNEKARGAISADPQGLEFPWLPKPMAKVAKMNPEDDVIEALNEKICVLLNVAPDDAMALGEFTAAGNAYTNPNVQFLTSGDADFLERVAGHVGFTATVAKSVVVAFNLPNNKAKEIQSGDINRETVKKFVDDFCSKQ